MPKKNPKIAFVNSNDGDWEGIYVDGVLKREGHSLSPDDVLSVLGIEYDTHYIDMEDGDRLPAKLKDISLTTD